MSFHLSAEDVRVEDNVLKARLAAPDGEFHDAELNLDEVLGNNNGSFQWGGGGFSGSAEDVSFEMEGDDGVPVLRATLTNVDGEGVPADVNLAEMIHNNSGEFHFESPNPPEEEE